MPYAEADDKPEEAIDQIWHLYKPTTKRAGINAISAWDVTRGAEVNVVIFDTGVEFRHPALSPNISFEPARDFDSVYLPEAPFTTSIRATRDGKPVDPDGRIGGKFGKLDNKFDAHGTACAGIVGAIEDPDCTTNFVGIAPACKLIPIKINANFEADSLINALDYALRLEIADIILLPRYMPSAAKRTNITVRLAALDSKLKEIAQRKPVVCASGNDGVNSLVYPASLPETIAVGACNDKGYRSTYSQYGDGLDVVAPSSDISADDHAMVRLSPEDASRRRWEAEARQAWRRGKIAPIIPDTRTPRDFNAIVQSPDEKRVNIVKYGSLSIATTDNLGEYGYNNDPPGNYCKATGDFGFGGTSAAAAQVAGVVALMLSANPKLRGSPEQIQDILRKTANRERDILKPEPPRGAPPLTAETRDARFREEFGYGLVDAAAAVAAATE